MANRDVESEPVNSASGLRSRSTWEEMRTSEDWWAVWLGTALLAFSLLTVVIQLPAGFFDTAVSASRTRDVAEISSPWKTWLGRPSSWSNNPLDAIYSPGDFAVLRGMFGVLAVVLVTFSLATAAMGRSPRRFALALLGLFPLAVLAYLLSAQQVIKHYNLEYALWALVVGLMISNTIGTPQWLRPAVRTEFYIKTGLVLLGAEVLFSRLLALGIPGVFVAWVVTPIVLIATYLFGQRVLNIESRSLNMVISADMSVCGVSAAIATAAACRAKKEELSLAIGMSLSFTVIMMIVMPAIIRALGMSDILGGAWIGGTIDSTGAVAAAGGILGEQALQVAATVKMIQNILIGIIAFGVAVYWVTRVDSTASGERPRAMEIWYRFPKFVLGFVSASIAFSLLYSFVPSGPAIVDASISQTKILRGWFFCLAFISIGLETDFRQLSSYLRGGKPLLLYLGGQTLNLALTLLMAWLMFEVVFRQRIADLLR